ncbi:MAG TPA: TOBE-like domain-containing protein [Solirubrobacteraceae bacterium]|jgi:sulfate transport system ATP-binding protein|nr:TOBE-like domain-containing protein [Solirubrobacteraceae bacterium]
MAIEVQDVTKRFGSFTALDEVSVRVPDGALMALLGPSGSGKSTLLRVIAGLETPDAGSVRIGGQELTDAPARTRGVGFVFQHYAPFKHMTVHDNVAFGLLVRKASKAQIDARVGELLELVRLDGLAKRYPSQLSGGQLQRMALARALAPEPQVLLLDEPFGALDVKVRAELREWLRRLHEEIHVTTIFVTHDQEEAMDVAGQIVVMNAGRIEQTGTPHELYEHPANEFVMSFVGPVNRLGDALLRPHDIQILRGGSDLYSEQSTVEALVRRVAHLGFEVRVELTLPDGRDVWAQVTRETAAELELAEGQILTARLPAPRVFAAA